VHLISNSVGARRAIGAALAAGLVCKVLIEAPWGAPLRVGSGWDFATAPLAHQRPGLSPARCARPRPACFAIEARRCAPMSDRKAHLDALAVSALIGCCFLWGLNQVAAKAALPEIPALWQAAARSLGGSLLVWVWARWRGIALFARDGTGPGGLLAGLLFAAEFACIFIGLEYTTASRMVVFLYLSPFVVALGMPFIARSERLAWPQLLGLSIAFVAVAWRSPKGSAGQLPVIASGSAMRSACSPQRCGVRPPWRSVARA
jgi:hypothetical protein